MAEPDLKEFKILILEDNPADIDLYKRRLTRQNAAKFDLTTAGTIADAKKCANEETFDCFVVDYRLPDGEGLDFVHFLTQSLEEHTKKPAVLMITGQGNEEIAVAAMKAGVHDYLTKRSISDGFFVRPILNAIQRAELSSQIQYYQNELERSNQELSDFTHTASHDLKAPLRRIISYCEMLEEDAGPKLSDDEKSMLSRMTLNASRMQNLISGLLSYSLIQSEKEEAEDTNLQVMMEEIRDEFLEQVEENNANVIISDLPTLQVYPMRIRQLFTNLFSNALKYRREEDLTIEISHEPKDGKCLFKVKDNGLGIDEAFHKDIFKDFKRLHNQEEIEGTGLGLAICRKIVEKHDGEIWLESEPGKGTTFFFTLSM
ncbi:MAG: hypothetical protein CL565_01535 [Alphaproteobacteria bacterium]|nr:hypothetical protein [Alphaproteobacteria bacterium]